MTYQMAATAVTLNDFEGHSQVAGLFRSNPSNICAAFYTISTDSMLARFLCISTASWLTRSGRVNIYEGRHMIYVDAAFDLSGGCGV